VSRVALSRVPVVLLLAALLAACGGDGAVQWRDATIEVPEDWHVFEDEETRLSIGNVPLGEQAGDPGEYADVDVVAMFFEHRPGTIPDDVREFVENREEGEIESDVAIEIDDVPGTRIIYSHVSGDVRTREMAVVIPSREIAVLAQPVPSPGDENAPELFMEYLDTFTEVLESIEWGAPIGRRDTSD
jgi:hypothetical protein